MHLRHFWWPALPCSGMFRWSEVQTQSDKVVRHVDRMLKVPLVVVGSACHLGAWLTSSLPSGLHIALLPAVNRCCRAAERSGMRKDTATTKKKARWPGKSGSVRKEENGLGVVT